MTYTWLYINGLFLAHDSRCSCYLV